MSSTWSLYADGWLLLPGGNYVPDEMMTVFRQSDRYQKTDLIREYEDVFEYEYENSLHEYERAGSSKYDRLIGYSTNVKTLLERLHLIGFSPDRIHSDALRILSEEIENWDGILYDEWAKVARSKIPNIDSLLDATVKRLRELNWAWPLREDTDELDSLFEEAWEKISHERQDIRFVLAILLRDLPGDCSCVLELTDLAKGGWLDWNDDLVSRATLRLQLETSASGKIIVLTEGSTDAAALRGALCALRPDVSDYFTFLDFPGFKADGGTSQAVSLAKGLAAASVMNRVVVVLDNDAAGREAEAQLNGIQLPPTFAVMRLPEQVFAREYPTLGPSGNQLENIKWTSMFD